MQASPAALQAPPQQGCPLPPQLTHFPSVQAVVAGVHAEPQQGWLSPPHAAHLPVVSQIAPP